MSSTSSTSTAAFQETPAGERLCLTSDDIDIYCGNVGGEHLEAVLNAMKDLGRIIIYSLISQYNYASYPVTIFHSFLVKRITMRGFTVSNADMGPTYTKEDERMQKCIKKGSFKLYPQFDNAAEGLAVSLRGVLFSAFVQDLTYGRYKKDRFEPEITDKM